MIHQTAYKIDENTMDITRLVKNVKSMFTLPEVALEINDLLNSSEPNFEELEDVILSDPALTATLLKMVNSAYFGFPGKIDKVSRAISIIGLKELRNITIAISVATQFKGIPSNLVDMDIFWYHSITRGVLAKILARKLKHADSERFFIAGLLSSIGKLIFFTKYPAQSTDILRLKDQGDEAMTRAEEETFGFNYAQLGAELLKEWKLPESIWELITYHLEPFNAQGSREGACILSLAASIANSIEPCAKLELELEELEPKLNMQTLEFLNLSPNQIHHSIDESVSQAFDIMTIIRPSATLIF